MDNSERDSKTKQDIEVLRKKLFDGLTKDKLDEFEEADLFRFRNDDRYCEQFLKHHDGNVEKAFHLVKESFKWRKEFGVYQIKEENIDINVRMMGVMYRKHHDKEGNPIIKMMARNYKKNSKLSSEHRRAAVLMFEECLRDSPTGTVSILADSEGAGIANYDVSWALFLTKTIINYYPAILGHAYICNMPLLFNAIWPIVLPLVPKYLRDKIVFVTKENIKEYIDDQFVPINMGGQDATEWVYTPGEWC